MPWWWDLYFTASELRHRRLIKIEQSLRKYLDHLDDDIKKNKLEDSQVITAVLHPGICDDGVWLQDSTSFSMLGTNRKIKEFGLFIRKLDDGDSDERCNL